MSVNRPALRYHGGKWRLAPWIIAQMPEHRVYVEPYGGAASVMMRKPRAMAEVYNDLDSTVVNVFRVLRDEAKAAELQRRLEFTPFSRADFLASYESPADDVDEAYKTIVRSFMGFSTDATTRLCKTGFRANKANGKFPAQGWATFPKSIPAFVDRLRGVVIERRNAIEVIAAYDSAETLFFVDPPYVLSTRRDAKDKHGYRYEMTDNDHRMLATMLRQVEGKVIICGYWSRLYEELYADWHREDKATHANGAHKRVDCAWRNFEALS
jgi:DNA adenine methylase